MADIRISIDEGAMERVLRDARRDALQEAATRLNALCMANSPVDTGNLRRSHEVGSVDAPARSIRVTATAPYAIFVHSGHRLVAWGRETGRYQPPNPWMSRALNAMMSGVE